MNKTIQKIVNFEEKHSVSTFILLIVLTVFLTRVTVLIKDFSPVIHGYELHHFHYGIILLVIVCLMMLFGKRQYKTWLALSAIAIGLIMDEFVFILGTMDTLQQYFATLPSAILFTFVVIMVVEIINIAYKKKKEI